MIKKSCLGTLFGILTLFFSSMALATNYALPHGDDSLIGTMVHTTVFNGETLVSIAKHYDVGLNSIVDANPGIKPNMPLTSGKKIRVPTFHVLPPLPKEGIVINLPEMRMYFYTDKGVIQTYPVGIGKIGKTIPIQRTSIARKATNPTWIPPEDIIAFNLQQGVTLPKVMPAGPDNPLGPYAIYLHIPTYLIHSTIFPESVGKRASFGCIRMHESDIKEFFPVVNAGTPVVIVDLPTKVGKRGKKLFLETHDPLEEHGNELPATYAGMIDAIQNATGKNLAFVDWQMVSDLAADRDGIPHEIGFLIG